MWHSVNSRAIDVAENLGVAFLYGVYRPWERFELIPTVEMETRHPVDGSFGNEFQAIYRLIIAELW